MRDPLVGRRAVFTRIETRYDDATKAMVEVSRATFRGVIAALITTGSNHYPAIVMLYDDGSLRTHDISTITVEADDSQEGPYR